MELMRWSPNRSLFGMSDNISHPFDNFFYPSLRHGDGSYRRDWRPVVDIFENEGNYVMTAEIPGVDKKDISIDVKDRILTLKGERSFDNGSNKGSYFRRERCHGEFERSFSLPMDVDSDKIDASFKDGVLRLEIPKPEDKKPKQITVH